MIFCVLTTQLIAATLEPSILSAIYFIKFLFTVTFWSLNKRVYKFFVRSSCFICIILIVHISTIFAYQTVLLKNYVQGNSTVLRWENLLKYFSSHVLFTLDIKSLKLGTLVSNHSSTQASNPMIYSRQSEQSKLMCCWTQLH